jgi:hypothetical protein
MFIAPLLLVSIFPRRQACDGQAGIILDVAGNGHPARRYDPVGCYAPEPGLPGKARVRSEPFDEVSEGEQE